MTFPWLGWVAPLFVITAVGVGAALQPAIAPPGDDELAEVAIGYFKADKNEYAWKTFREVLARNPRHFRANYGAGMLAFEEDKLPEAERYFLAALKARPEHSDAALTLGAVYQQAGQYHRAMQVYDELLRRAPNVAGVYYNAARLQLRLGNTESATRFLKVYLRLAPTASDRGQVENTIRGLESASKGKPTK